MKLIPVKPTKRTDGANYISPVDQERVRHELRYRISNRLEAVLDRKGEVALVLHDGDEYQADTVLSEKARAKLAYVLLKAGGKEGK